jgi:glucose-1-phosphate cytidylyltransferase
VWINGGFMVLRRDIFGYIKPGEELVIEPFTRLIERGELIAFQYEGFWEPMDTIKDKQRLDALADSGKAPWRRAGIDATLTR